MSGPEPAAVDPSTRLGWDRDVLVRRTPRSVLLYTNGAPEPVVLRDSAVTVWDEFRTGATPAAVASDLAARFGVDHEDAGHDIAPLIAQLCRAGALTELRQA